MSGARVRNLASSLLLLVLGCDSGRAVSDLQEVSVEEGSFCQTPEPCWKRVSLTAALKLRLESYAKTLEAVIAPAEITPVEAITSDPVFVSTISSSCPFDLSDFQVIIVVKRGNSESRDPFGAGCVVLDPDPSGQRHPYYRLRETLDGLAKRYFGEGLFL